jgi:hypothetical protein
MDGSILSIPFDRLDDFYKVYVQSIRQREYIYVVEQKTFPYYNFFVDIDYTSDDALELHEIEDISRYICKTVRQFSDSECLVSVAKPKSKGDLVKTGIHLNWGEFVIDQDNSINMRDHIICELSCVYPSKNWNSIVDKAVYGNPQKSTHGSGFRMPWSHKKGKHDYCNGQGCSACENTGKIIEGEYLPCFVYDQNKTLRTLESQEPTVELLYLSSIRFNNSQKCTIVNVPEVFCKPIKEGGFTQKQLKNEIVMDNDIQCQLETFIRKFMKGQQNTKIIKILKNEDSYFVQTDSKYCENLGRDHNSNHIWFYISRERTIHQKCFCTCLVKRKGGSMCKDFNGQEHDLKINKVVNFLFPEKKLLITCNNNASYLRIDDYFNNVSDTDPCIEYISSRLQQQ